MQPSCQSKAFLLPQPSTASKFSAVVLHLLSLLTHVTNHPFMHLHRGNSLNSKILKDRLYRSKASPDCLAAMGGVAPDFPFSFADIKQSRGPTINRAAQEAQRQAEQQANHAAQQQQQQQTATTSAAYGQTAAPAATSSATDTLPPGWMAIQDPASGMYYYANQSTGEVTWDLPQAVPAPQPAPAPAPLPSQPAPQGQQPTPNASRSSTPNRTAALASKYGDGFVTSSSHPELADQYGNVGTR
jgi:protein transport protein SEC31